MKSKAVCFGCLKRGHQRWKCRKASRCGIDSCAKGHHPLLHSAEPQEEVRCGKAATNAPSATAKVALKTTCVPFVSASGQTIWGTVLLDSGSETTLIRTAFARQLGLRGPSKNLVVDAVGGVRSTVKSERVCLPFARPMEEVFAWTMRNICAPTDAFDWPEIKQRYEHLRDIPFQPVNPAAVDVLLGSDAAGLMSPLQVRRGSVQEPCAELTPLGWVVSGPIASAGTPTHRILRAHISAAEEDAGQLLRKFWEVDSFGVQGPPAPTYTRDEQATMSFLDGTCRQVDSGYEMGLLWKPDRPPLPDNYPMALKRLQSVERRLQRDPKLAEGYSKAINAYVGKGFARKLSAAERAADGEQWLLPHHPVVSPHKPLPRVVFDSAAKHQGVCLNDCLQTGSSLHNDLPGILLRFRESPVALAGDVSDMFCHVRLRPDDCKYHRYLWRDVELERPPDVYEMNCLVFGDRASPCQANFAVLRTVKDNQKRWPQAAAAVRRNIFVDDFYIACADVPTAISLRADVTALMARGGFPKCESGCPRRAKYYGQFPKLSEPFPLEA